MTDIQQEELPLLGRRPWISVTADILDHPVVGVRRGEPYSRTEAWIWLLRHARVTPKQITHRGRVIILQRRQLLGGRDYLAKQWRWGIKKVRVFLKELAASGQLDLGQSRGHYANIVTICNYDKYQFTKSSQGPVKGPVKGQKKRQKGPDSNKVTTVTEKESSVVSFGDSRREADEAAEYVAQQKAKHGLMSEAEKREARSKQDAAQVPHEAQDQATVVWDDEGRIEVFNGFRAELLGKLKDTGLSLEDALAEAAGKVGDHLRGIPLQKAVRAQVTQVARWARNDLAKRRGGAPAPSGQRHKSNPDAEFMANQEAGMAIREHMWGSQLVTGAYTPREPVE